MADAQNEIIFRHGSGYHALHHFQETGQYGTATMGSVKDNINIQISEV